MKHLIQTLFLFCLLSPLYSQVEYGTPKKDLVPSKLQGMRQAISVIHFPSESHPIKVGDIFYWKHLTSVFCEENEIKITEFGAYIYYNKKWNLRQSYPIKDFNKFFNSKKEIMLQAQPYTWTDNYRSSDAVFAGWALWYFIGETPSGETVCGYETIYTSDKLLN